MSRRWLLVASVLVLPLVAAPTPLAARISGWMAQVEATSTDPAQLFQQGVRQYQQSQYPAALASFEQVLPLLQADPDRERRLEVLNYLGLIYESQGQYAKGLTVNQQAVELARAVGDRQMEGVSLANLGNLYSQMGEYPKSLEFYTQALELLRAVGDRDSEAATLTALGRVYRNQSQYGKALEFYQQALTIQRQSKDRQGEGTTLNNIGVTYQSQSQYGKALEFYQQALAIRRETKDRRGEGLSLSNLGSVYSSLGQYAKALELFQQALTIRRELGDRAGEGSTLNSIGLLYDNLGQPEKALQIYQQTLELRRQVGDRRGESVTLTNLGRVYTRLNRAKQAISTYEQALQLYRQLGDRAGEGVALNNLGEVYRQSGEFAKALEFYQQSLTIRREVGNRTGEGIVLNNLGSTYQSLRQPAAALKSYQQALAILQEVGDRPTSAITLGNIGAIYTNLKNYPAATQALQQSVEILESLRPGLSDANKVSIFETQQNVYKQLQGVLVAQTRFSEALQISERGRARAFVERLAGRLAAQSGTSVSLTSIAPPTIQEIQQIARDQKATLVEYAILEPSGIAGEKQTPQILIWVVKPSGEITFRRQTALPFTPELVTTARQAIGVRGLSFQENTTVVEQLNRSLNQRRPIQPDLQRLHQLLIQPIADLLPQNPTDRVIFIPQSTLFLVPFAALQDPTGKYLIEQHTLLTVPAIQVLSLTRQQRQRWAKQPSPPNQVLIVGNPTMPQISPQPGAPPQQLASLPGAEQEARTIAALFNTQALIGNQATKAALIQALPTAKIIHLATHGLLDNLVPSEVPGAIALAPDGQDNGFLTADQILNLQLNADLVVLSACDTGRGKITGDGVIGLSRSLILAGTPSVIVSLWQIPDAPTATLMKAFYQNRLNQQDKAQALRQAMLTTLQTYPDPKNWAAFTLIGEAE